MSKTKHAPYTLRLYLSIYCIGLSLSIYFYALSCVLRFSLLIALRDLFSFVEFSEGKGNERRESNPQRRCLLASPCVYEGGGFRCDPSGHHAPPIQAAKPV